MAYTPKSDEDLKQLAKDVYAGRVFTSKHIEQQGRVSDLHHVFMPLMLASKEIINSLEEDDITMLYEDMNKSTKMAINGMPTFWSMCCLNREDTNRFTDFYNKIIEAMKNI